jgi:LuxR family maltose regulon positive regulatory protein
VQLVGKPAGVQSALEQAGPIVLVLDGERALRTRGCLDLLSTIVEHLQPGSQLAMGARTDPDLPLADWCVHHDLVRLGPAELAMTRDEAGALLHATGLDLGPDEVAALHHRTEGWPAGLHLAALAILEQDDPVRAVSAFAGDDRLVARYFREQLLGRLPPDLALFLLRASVLDELSGDACNAVLGRADSGHLLAELERSNAFLIPLDRRQQRYRAHRLLQEMLRAELHRQDAALEGELYRRASAWHEAAGEVEAAIRHAHAADDLPRVGTLVWENLPRALGGGQLATVRRWLEGLRDEQIAVNPPLAIGKAWCCLDAGDTAAAELWAAAAERGVWGSSSRGAAQAAVRAVLAGHGVTRMSDDAAFGREVGSPAGPWRHVCCLVEGVAWRLRGERELARARLEEAAGLAAGHEAPAVLAPSLAQLALVARDEGDSEGAAALVSRARAALDTEGPGDKAGRIQVRAAAAQVFAGGGRLHEARAEIEGATELLTGPGRVAPWLEIDARIALANANLLAGDAARAQALIRDADVLMARIPDAGLLGDWLEDCRRRADAFRTIGVLGASALSKAELRIVQLLPTHLSYREIAEQLQRSQHTVKTQALAAFRKLDVSSRSEAVERARTLGLISG